MQVAVSGHPAVSCYDVTVDVPDYSQHNLDKISKEMPKEDAIEVRFCHCFASAVAPEEAY
jgi:hypothetical protein